MSGEHSSRDSETSTRRDNTHATWRRSEQHHKSHEEGCVALHAITLGRRSRPRTPRPLRASRDRCPDGRRVLRVDASHFSFLKDAPWSLNWASALLDGDGGGCHGGNGWYTQGGVGGRGRGWYTGGGGHHKPDSAARRHTQRDVVHVLPAPPGFTLAASRVASTSRVGQHALRRLGRRQHRARH